MNYAFNGHLPILDRIKLVATEIKKQYPSIDTESALLAACFEKKITTEITPEFEFYRLYNILTFIKKDKILSSEIVKDLYDLYENIRDERIFNLINDIESYYQGKKLEFPKINDYI